MHWQRADSSVQTEKKIFVRTFLYSCGETVPNSNRLISYKESEKSLMECIDITATAEKKILKEGMHAPTIIVEFAGLPSPLYFPLRSFPNTPELRQHTLFLHGKQVADQYYTWKVQRIWFISEAWMSRVQQDQESSLAPSQDPRRQEVLMVIELDTLSGELQQKVEIRLMKRNKNGKLKKLIHHPDLGNSTEKGKVTAYGILALSFLAGFADTASFHHSSYGSYGSLYTKILQEQKMLNILQKFKTSW